MLVDGLETTSAKRAPRRWPLASGWCTRRPRPRRLLSRKAAAHSPTTSSAAPGIRSRTGIFAAGLHAFRSLPERTRRESAPTAGAVCRSLGVMQEASTPTPDRSITCRFAPCSRFFNRESERQHRGRATAPRLTAARPERPWPVKLGAPDPIKVGSEDCKSSYPSLGSAPTKNRWWRRDEMVSVRTDIKWAGRIETSAGGGIFAGVRAGRSGLPVRGRFRWPVGDLHRLAPRVLRRTGGSARDGDAWRRRRSHRGDARLGGHHRA